MTIYTTTQEWQCPAGVTSVDIIVVGGGGRGHAGEPGTYGTSTNGHGGDGGSEGTQTSATVDVTPGSYYTLTVGGPGVASSFLGETGAAGADGVGYNGAAYGSDGDAGYSTGVSGSDGADGTYSAAYYGGAGGVGYGAGGGGGGGGNWQNSGEAPAGGVGAQGCVVITYTLPVAGFVGDVLSGYTPVVTNWSNSSTDATSYHWYFGDGSESTDATPAAHSYTLPGKYTVILTAMNAYGFDLETKTDYIVVAGPPLCHGFIIMGDRLRGV